MKVLDREEYIAGSLAMTGRDRLTNGSCFGLGCSQVPVPCNKMTSFRPYTKRNTESTSSVEKWSFNNCTYGFVVNKDDHYTFQETDFDNMHKKLKRCTCTYHILLLKRILLKHIKLITTHTSSSAEEENLKPPFVAKMK
ncbi:hypothetical protein Hanom_Chr10g00873941 [Helianthus anomalus]